MIYGSVCSGIEAATVAWHPLGWRCAFVSEIEQFPSAVLAHRYPDVPNFGDMTRYREWPDAILDVLVGGTPCQSFSVAGLRKGLDDPRGNLALVFLGLVDRFRPRWVVWENVPGVLSSSGGRDFGAFLGALAQLGYGFSYRVLDAQHFGVPQRRRRVFVVGHLGDWRPAAAVLFERHSLSGDSPPRREAGQRVAPTVSQGAPFSRTGNEPVEADAMVPVLAKALRAATGGIGREDGHTLIAHSLRAGGFDASEDGTGRGTPLVTTLAIRGRGGESTLETRDDGLANAILTPNGGRAGIGVGAVAIDLQQVTSKVNRSQPTPQSPPLTTNGTVVAFSAKDHGADAGELAPTLRSMGHDGSHANGGGQVAVALDPNGLKGYVSAYGSAQENNATEILSGVRTALGAEAFAEWGLGILDSLLPAEVLRQALHGVELRAATFTRRWVVYCALSRTEDRTQGAVLSMREAEGAGCPPQGRRLPQQLAEQLGTYLSELSQPGAQAERFVHDLWCASEGLGVLRQALSALQAVGRSARHQAEPASALAVRRLTPEEAEFLQGFPRGYTAIPYRNKPAADGNRYKALGNSMAVPVMAWLGQRIAAVDALLAEKDGAA